MNWVQSKKILVPTLLVVLCLLAGTGLAYFIRSAYNAKVATNGNDLLQGLYWIAGILLLLSILSLAYRHRNVLVVVDKEEEGKKNKKLRSFFKKAWVTLGIVIGIHFFVYLWAGDEFVMLMNTEWWWKLIVTIFFVGIAVQYGDAGKKVAWGIGLLALAAIGLAWYRSPHPQKTVATTTEKVALTPGEKIAKAFHDAPIMRIVADCESGSRQFRDDGSVVVNKERFVGLFQIDKEAHKELIEKTGLDPYTVDGNIALARLIYDSNPDNPSVDWSSSKSSCWGDALEDPEHSIMADLEASASNGGWGPTIAIRALALQKWGNGISYTWILTPRIETDEGILLDVDGQIIDTTTGVFHIPGNTRELRMKLKSPEVSVRRHCVFITRK